MWAKVVRRVVCAFKGHLFMRRPLDPTMRQNSFTEIYCVHCELVVDNDKFSLDK